MLDELQASGSQRCCRREVAEQLRRCRRGGAVQQMSTRYRSADGQLLQAAREARRRARSHAGHVRAEHVSCCMRLRLSAQHTSLPAAATLEVRGSVQCREARRRGSGCRHATPHPESTAWSAACWPPGPLVRTLFRSMGRREQNFRRRSAGQPPVADSSMLAVATGVLAVEEVSDSSCSNKGSFTNQPLLPEQDLDVTSNTCGPP